MNQNLLFASRIVKRKITSFLFNYVKFCNYKIMKLNCVSIHKTHCTNDQNISTLLEKYKARAWAFTITMWLVADFLQGYGRSFRDAT